MQTKERMEADKIRERIVDKIRERIAHLKQYRFSRVGGLYALYSIEESSVSSIPIEIISSSIYFDFLGVDIGYDIEEAKSSFILFAFRRGSV